MNTKLLLAAAVVVLVAVGAVLFVHLHKEPASQESAPIQEEQKETATVPSNPYDAAPVTVGEKIGAFTVVSIESKEEASGITKRTVRYTGSLTLTGTYEEFTEHMRGGHINQIDDTSAALIPPRYVGASDLIGFCLDYDDHTLTKVKADTGITNGSKVRATVTEFTYVYYPSGGCARTAHTTLLEKI